MYVHFFSLNKMTNLAPLFILTIKEHRKHEWKFFRKPGPGKLWGRSRCYRDYR